MQQSNGGVLSTSLQAMQGAEDDDAWMRDGADDLEQELAARERETSGKHAASSGSDFDPDSLAQRFKVCPPHLISDAIVNKAWSIYAALRYPALHYMPRGHSHSGC